MFYDACTLRVYWHKHFEIAGLSASSLAIRDELLQYSAETSLEIEAYTGYSPCCQYALLLANKWHSCLRLQISGTHASGLHSSQSRRQSFLHKHSSALPVSNVISSCTYQANVSLSTCLDMNLFKCIQACSRQAEKFEISDLIQLNNRLARYDRLLFLNPCLEIPSIPFQGGS